MLYLSKCLCERLHAYSTSVHIGATHFPATNDDRCRSCLLPGNQGHQTAGISCILATKDTRLQELPLPWQPRTLGCRSCLHTDNQGHQVAGTVCVPATKDTRWQKLPISWQARTLWGRNCLHHSNQGWWEVGAKCSLAINATNRVYLYDILYACEQ